jgi:ribosome-associated protein
VKDAREFAIEVARLASHTRCHEVVILDVSGISSVTDYFVIATGTSVRQMRTVCDEAAELGAKVSYKPYHTSGYEGEHWIAIDFVDVVLHIFNQESRMYYDLEGLWGDAQRVQIPA